MQEQKLQVKNQKWETRKLCDLEEMGVIQLGRGNIISKSDLIKNPGNYPVYSASKLNKGEFGRYGKYMFDEELITWSIDGGGDFFYRPKHRFSVTNVCGWLRILKPEILNYKYLYFVLDWTHEKLYFNYIFKAHPSVIREKYEIPLPPLEIQKRIVAKIEQLFEKIDKAIELRKKAIEETEQIFQSAVQEVISKSMKKYKVDKIKNILVDVQSGFACSKRAVQDIGVPQLRPNNIGFNGKIDFSNIVFIPKKFVNQNKYKLKKGDVLFNNTNSKELVGRAVLVERNLDCVFSNHITRLRVNLKILLPEWLVININYLWSIGYFLKFSQKWIGQAGVNTQMLKFIQIPLPPLSEQEKIVSYLNNLREKVDKLKRVQEEQLKELEELKKSILEKA
ncbi:MAG: restriction endonuclease subunit S, partial [Candidatus Omnitrophica bacterium]|nr:restriction endonuclease subunit S [Candidatus Omnitrophota bacterium]